MKLRLPKMLLVVVMVGFAVSPAMADYVWQGGDTVSADNWNVSENWELTGSTTYPMGGNGPATPNSNGWDRLVIDGASGTTANLEGWAFHLSLNSLTTDGTTRGFAVTVGSEAWAAIVAEMGGDVYQNATITLNGESLDQFRTVSFNGYSGTGTQGEYFVAYIPEPATATLSLLALAALAARRRRK